MNLLGLDPSLTRPFVFHLESSLRTKQPCSTVCSAVRARRNAMRTESKIPPCTKTRRQKQ